MSVVPEKPGQSLSIGNTFIYTLLKIQILVYTDL